MSDTPITLGKKLSLLAQVQPLSKRSVWLQKTLHSALRFSLVVSAFALFTWWLAVRPNLNSWIVFVLIGMLILGWVLVAVRQEPIANKKASKAHSLIAHDCQGFMADLRLDEKTAVIDGSNLYHFGRDNELDVQVLGLVAYQLRADGYRVVCFFDANIFYTLRDHGAFAATKQHTFESLGDLFGLGQDEIYVVPSGVQADKFILNSLRHMPISFAVTNDKFRDYGKDYSDVMKGDEWRKSVRIDGAEIKLFKHRFKSPVLLN